TRLERVRHAHAVHLVKDVVGQVVTLIEAQEGAEVRSGDPGQDGCQRGRVGKAKERSFFALCEGAVPITWASAGGMRAPARKRLSLYSKPIFSSETGTAAAK